MDRPNLVVLGAWALLAAACVPGGGAATAQPDDRFRVETVAENLEAPWEIVFDHTGRMIFTERPGRVRTLRDGRLDPEPLYTVPDVRHRAGAEIGLMGLCLHPNFAENGLLYLAYGHTDGDVRVVRYREVPHEAGEERTTLAEDRIILRGAPAGLNHAGCRIAFGPDAKLYITTGEAYRRELAQDMTSLGGKTLRINDDGSIPADNPFNTPEHREAGVRPEIWTSGHRNAQGMDWHPITGLMYQSEHGPSGEKGTDGDELNLVERGKNYGWPIISHAERQPGPPPLETPLVEWTPAIAPGSGRFYSGDLLPDLRNNFLVGALRGQALFRIVISDSDPRQIVEQERIVRGVGRIRAVAQGPDGAVYFSTSNRDGRGRPAENDDRILRLLPAGP